MDLSFVRGKIIAQTYREVLPGKFDSEGANLMLLAIGLQESRFEHRQQIGGPARSFWQFERNGGVAGVLMHASTGRHAHAVCILRGIAPTKEAVYARMIDDDLLGCAFARLLLYTDPAPLPELGDAAGAWAYYLRNWRPGKPHQSSWNGLYAQARLAA